ncbi:MAG: hypothetical protein V2J24_21055 [Pseudomonadales bacterium]|jgi:hypothetical protein|nr:hypothetical protein [Pseudomonadales bacterium]
MATASEAERSVRSGAGDGAGLKIFLGTWALLCACLLGALSMGHVVAFPEPERDRLAGLLAALHEFGGDAPGRLAVHVIASDCSCTESLFRHLVEHGPVDDTEEVILFVGPEHRGKRAASRAAGYRFVNIAHEELEALGLESAPVLADFAADGRIRYLGGYYDHPSASNPLDLRLRTALDRGERVAPLPIYGCAVSARLREAFDPLGLLYES